MADPSSSPRARTLIVGLGRQGRRHLRVAGTTGLCDVVGTVDPVAAPVPGIPSYPTVTAALEALGPGAVDLAVVATPVGDHLASGRELLGRGIPTLVEKPLALTAAEGEELVARAEETGTLLAVGHVERFNPCVQLVTALLESGSVGRPVACSFRRVGLPPPSTPDVDVILDLGVHDIDVFRLLVGGPATYAGASGWVGADGLVESAHVLVAHGPVHGLVEVNWRTPVRLRGFSVTTEQCLVEVNYTTQSVEVVEASRVEDFEEFAAFQSHYGAARRTHLEAKVAEPLAEQMVAFVGAVRGEPQPQLARGADGLGALAIALEASGTIARGGS